MNCDEAFEALTDGKSRSYNLGTGRGYSNREVVEVARHITNCPIPVVSGARRAGDLPILIAYNQLIQDELGWKPQYPALEQIIETAWTWHRSHPNGFED